MSARTAFLAVAALAGATALTGCKIKILKDRPKEDSTVVCFSGADPVVQYSHARGLLYAYDDGAVSERVDDTKILSHSIIKTDNSEIKVKAMFNCMRMAPGKSEASPEPTLLRGPQPEAPLFPLEEKPQYRL